MNLERSNGNLERKLNRVDPVTAARNKTGLSIWKDKPTIPLEKWIEIRNAPYALDYFPDDFDQMLAYISEDQSKQGLQREVEEKWNSDYLELMGYTKNPNYGRLKCFRCLLSPDGDDPIFIGINRLVAKGLNNGGQQGDGIRYPFQVVNRFQCPYERTNTKRNDDHEPINSKFNVKDLFRLQKIAIAVEIALAKARKCDSEIQIKDKHDLLHALTDRDKFMKILPQASDLLNSTEYRDITSGHDNNDVVDYFMRLNNKINTTELRFY